MYFGALVGEYYFIWYSARIWNILNFDQSSLGKIESNVLRWDFPLRWLNRQAEQHTFNDSYSLSDFVKSRKTTTSFVMFVCLFIPMEQTRSR
jgi:hypothetical protein